MPTLTRRQADRRSQRGSDQTAPDVLSEEVPQVDAVEEIVLDRFAEYVPDVDVEEEDDEEDDGEPEEFPPPGLKEISSLASWTVSSAKPGNGVAALRSPDVDLFWQSDGPQPHLLSIHFFKMVSIVYMRIYLDFVNDESYTPTKIQFLAGTGIHDIQEFAEMNFEQPTGWIDVDFSNVGPDGHNSEDEDAEMALDWSKRPVLRAFLVQVRILENHQNGKDTHLRAVQLFARDEMGRRSKHTTPDVVFKLPTQTKPKDAIRVAEQNNIKLTSWMLDPDLR